MRKQAGLSLVELTVAISIAGVAALGLMSAYMTSINHAKLMQEHALATNAIRAKAEEMRANTLISFGEFSNIDGVIERYQSPNDVFAVDGLPPDPAAPAVGQVILYLDENEVPVELGGGGGAATGTLDGTPVGPMDLDGDGSDTDVFAAPVDTEYGCNLLPAEIRIRWQSPVGPVVRQHFLLLSRTPE